MQKTSQKVTISSGWGYWDITHYPYGGCFKRAPEEIPNCTVLGPGCKPFELKIRLPNGNTASVDKRALRDEDPCTT